jgi:hypothetical protein
MSSLINFIHSFKNKPSLVPTEEVSDKDMEAGYSSEELDVDVDVDVDTNDKKPIVTGKFVKVDPSLLQKKQTNFKFVITLIVSLFSIALMIYYSIANEPVNLDYLKHDSSYSNKIEYGMSARMIGHHRHHWLKCSDFDYGCCEVNYDSAGYNITVTLSVYKIVKHDPVGSNCPTIQTMIDGYNNVYADYCSDTKEGCCMIDDYRINMKQNDDCPRERDIIHMYETNYEDYIADYITMLCLFGFIICICCLTKK